MLVGEAGGFVLPVSGEGIGTSIKSGLLAADSIIKATKSGVSPDGIYLEEVEVIISTFSKLLPWFKRIVTETKGGGCSLPQVLAEAYGDTLKAF
ncbi:NAD(P)/FAD-dependent oxidoreductase [Chloroflexota bacterium]